MTCRTLILAFIFLGVSYYVIAQEVLLDSLLTKDQECSITCIEFEDILSSLQADDLYLVHDFAINCKKRIKKSKKKCCNRLMQIAIDWDKKVMVNNDSIISKKHALLGAYLKAVFQPEKALANLNIAEKYASKYYDKTHPEYYKIRQNMAESYWVNEEYELSNLYLDTAYAFMQPDTFQVRKRRIFQYYVRNAVSLGDSYLFNIYCSANSAYLDYDNKKSRTRFLLDQAVGNYKLKNYNKAIGIIETFVNDHGLENLTQKERYLINNNLGCNYLELDDLENASKYFEKTKPYVKKSSLTMDHVVYLNNIAIIESRKNNYQKSNIILKQALSHNYNLGKIYALELNNLVNQSRWESAYSVLGKIKTLDKGLYHPLSDTEEMANYYEQVLLLLIENYNLSKETNFLYEAEKYINVVDSLFSIRTESVIDNESDILLLSEKRYIYQLALETCFLLFDETKNSEYAKLALHLMEQSKAIILLRHNLKNVTAASNSTRRQKIIISVLDSLSAISSNKEVEIFTRLRAANQIQNKALELRNLINDAKLKPLSNSDNYIAATSKDKQIIQYFDGSTAIYYVHLANGKISLDKSQLPNKDDITEFVSQINSTKVIDPILLEKFSKLLPKKLNSTPIIVIPDGIMSLIPFEILMYNKKMLFQNNTTSYAFSLRHLSQMQDYINQSSSHSFTTFAPSYSDQPAYVSKSDNLGKLLHNEPEVEAIKNYYPQATNYVGGQATLNNFMETAPNCNVLHIAAHAKSDTTEAGCHIYFSDDNKNYTLSLSDIYKMTIPAELVTLSACETATGEHLAGEGVLSLARGFAYAGAKSVVSSLWSANDQSTSMIMDSFYKYLSEGQRKDEALRNAKLDFLANTDSEYHHPYYWAAFIPVGDMSPLPQKKNNKWYYGLAAFLLGAGGISYRRKLSLRTS